MQSIKIIDAIPIKSERVCLLVLDKPYLKVGWMGVSYVNSISEIK